MNLLDISKLAARTIVRMAVDGKLSSWNIWTAIKGAEKYLAACVSGDKAKPIDGARRVQVCDACPYCVYDGKPSIGVKAMYCGIPFDEQPPPGPCGCLVGVLVKGKPIAGGKTLVASEACPSGRWARVPPEGYNPNTGVDE